MSDENAVLVIDKVTKKYGRLTVLDAVSLSLPAGAIVALLGANGAGKTTTFKCILGLTSFKGRISVTGKSVTWSGKDVRKIVGYLPQAPGFSNDDTCHEALQFLGHLRSVPDARVDELLDQVNLARQRDTRIGDLSGGMKQRLALAAALLSDPPLLLLDEPTANLDYESQRELHDLLVQLRSEGRTIVLSTHFVDHVAEIADRIVLLKDGAVALDRPAVGLRAGGGDITVHLNGTSPASVYAALRDAGVKEEHINPMGVSLQDAINRELATMKKEDGQ
ncbi:MAG TPA: ABC transporter ATP-binding protein [Dehalococcoidia bacterium]|nr:ABC transporter ATP-binding protein [Dehalococcoidia bacterium]